MSERRDLPSIIDRCLDDIVAGRASLSECLQAYPEHRAELEPVLRAATALHATPRRPQRPVDPIRRAMLMELIRETPQQRRSWLPGLGGLLTGGLLPRLAAAGAPVAVAIALGAFLLLAQPSSPAAAATLTLFAGGAEEQVNSAWRPLSDGAALREGARVRTTSDGHALLTLPDGSTSTLEPSTEIAIERLVANTPRDVQIRQFAGRLWNDVVHDDRAGARFEVITEDAVVRVLGTVFETAVNDGETSVSTAEGQVDVLAGSDRVSVPSGQLVRARAQRVADRGTVVPSGSLTIDGPFAGALVSARGEATGARPDGALFRQIRGVTTSNPGEGPQRFEFQRMEPGTYTLRLQRFQQGTGDIVLDVDGAERRIPIDAQTGTAEVRVRVDLQDGQRRLALLEETPVVPAPPAERPPVRLVETERTKKAEDIVAQRAAALKRGTPAQPTPNAALDAFAARLREATLKNDPAAIRAALQEVAAAAEGNDLAQRLRLLAGLLNNGDSARRIAAAAAGDAVLRTRVLERAGTLPPDQFERFRRALLGIEEPRPTPPPVRTPTPARTPTPTGTPAATSTGTPAPTSSATPSATPTGSPTPRTQLPPPAIVDGFGIRLRVAVATNNDDLIRRTLGDIVSDSDETTRSRLAVLAMLVRDEDQADRVERALSGAPSAGLRARLLAAVEENGPPDGRDTLREVIAEASVAPAPPVPTATASGSTTRRPETTGTR